MRVICVDYRGGDGVIVGRVRAVHDVAVPQVGGGEGVLGGEVVIATDRNIVPRSVIPSGEGIPCRVSQQRGATVSRAEIVDLVRPRNLTDQALNNGIKGYAGSLQYVDLPHRSGLVAIREHALPCAVGQNGSVGADVLPVPEGLVIGIEEEFVLDDVPAEGGPELILVQERLGYSVFVVEPGSGSERIVAVVPIARAVIGVPAGWSGQRDLRGAAAHRRVRVGRRDREL